MTQLLLLLSLIYKLAAFREMLLASIHFWQLFVWGTVSVVFTIAAEPIALILSNRKHGCFAHDKIMYAWMKTVGRELNNSDFIILKAKSALFNLHLVMLPCRRPYVLLHVCMLYYNEHYISGCLEGISSNIQLDSGMSWLDSSGQRSAWPHNSRVTATTWLL